MAFSLGSLAIMVIVVIAILAIVGLFIKQSGVAIPPLVVNIFWVIVCAVLCILAIKFVMGVA